MVCINTPFVLERRHTNFDIRGRRHQHHQPQGGFFFETSAALIFYLEFELVVDLQLFVDFFRDARKQLLGKHLSLAEHAHHLESLEEYG